MDSQQGTFDLRTAAGSSSFGWLDICTMADGSPLRIPVHVFVGVEPEPRLTVIAAQHGYEVNTVAVCRELVQQVDAAELKGTLVVIPVANPISFEGGSRSTWVDSLYGDNGNMNRVWPGSPNGWLTERMVYQIGEQLIKGSDAIIDLHNGSTALPGLSIYYGYAFSTSDKELSHRVRKIASASGFEILIKRQVTTLAGSLGSYALAEGIPFFACEVGDFYGLQIEESDLPSESPLRSPPECGVTAILNIMKSMGMLEGTPKLPERQILISPENNLRPNHGGLLYSEVGQNAIGRVVPKDTLLGTVINAYDFSKLDEIRAPYDRNLIIAVTNRPPATRVNAGDYGYIVADMETAEWIEH